METNSTYERLIMHFTQQDIDLLHNNAIEYCRHQHDENLFDKVDFDVKSYLKQILERQPEIFDRNFFLRKPVDFVNEKGLAYPRTAHDTCIPTLGLVHAEPCAKNIGVDVIFRDLYDKTVNKICWYAPLSLSIIDSKIHFVSVFGVYISKNSTNKVPKMFELITAQEAHDAMLKAIDKETEEILRQINNKIIVACSVSEYTLCYSIRNNPTLRANVVNKLFSAGYKVNTSLSGSGELRLHINWEHAK